jgi:hypothetical protein
MHAVETHTTTRIRRIRSVGGRKQIGFGYRLYLEIGKGLETRPFHSLTMLTLAVRARLGCHVLPIAGSNRGGKADAREQETFSGEIIDE